jgi:hypothetical protein
MTRASGPRFLLYVVLLLAAPASPLRAQAAGSGQSDSDLTAYRSHLQNLETVVADCRKQRTADACSAYRVGSDDNVQWKSGGAVAMRAIRYDWLREVLSRAGRKEEPQKPAVAQTKGAAEKPVTVDDLLAQAQQRLQDDVKQAGGASAPEPDHAAARKSITEILSRRVYRGVSQTSGWEKFQEWLENLLASIFGHLASFSKAAPWIGRALEILFIDALGIALVWALIRLERRSRVRLVPDAQPAPSAPSARQWQLWFQDAQQMAAQGLWREAIHFLYWAAISRLESKRMWPADRARTPREYLGLFPAADPRRDNLTGLTRSFEKTWYGGREAGSNDFDAALKMAAGLGVE